MEDGLLRQIVVVTSPNLLPPGDHTVYIDSLSRKYQLVILMCFGDERYNFAGSCLPYNARILYYDYENLDTALAELKEHLAGFGVDMISRHKLNNERLPFVLGGSILRVPNDVHLSFLSKEDAVDDPQKISVNVPDAEWDL